MVGWLPDAEFPYGPQGAKPKRIFICPDPPPKPFLIGGHRYLFKEPSRSRMCQIWSEVISYEIARHLGLQVPPAFLATGPETDNPGVLIEFFYGHPGDSEYRFVHAIERFQGLGIPVNLRRGSLRDNIQLCRLHRIADWRDWWSDTLIFDTMIGNTDRHSENWGFMTLLGSDGIEYRMAPAFDNGTSLGFIVRDEDLEVFTDPQRLSSFVNRGTHHFGWQSGDHTSAKHVELCKIFYDKVPELRRASDIAIALANDHIEDIVDWCSRFSFPLRFSPQRGQFVSSQLCYRRSALQAAFGG